MGLAIARAIIRAHGEEIWVTSKPGQGSEFAFSLPVARPGGVQ
jgi:signal transduction histidine kinase